MSAVATSCPSCDRQLPPGARFCVGCGTRVAQQETVVYGVTDRRTFGVLPGRARMRAVQTRVRRWLAVASARIQLAAELVAARVEAQILRFRLKRYAARLDRDRSACLHALGQAVYTCDEQGSSRAKSHLVRLDVALAEIQAQLRRVDEHMRERVERAKAESGETVAVEPVPVPEPYPEPVPEPYPQPVPEPSPEPSPAPGPVIVPEPELE